MADQSILISTVLPASPMPLFRDEAHGEVTESDSMMKKIFPQGPLAIHHVPENSKLLKFASFISQDYKYGIVLNLYMGKGMCLEHCKCPTMIYLPAVTAGFEMFTRCTLFL